MQDTNANKNPIANARIHALGGSSSSQACAACKYQRRKCEPNCPLARHFPSSHQKQFLNAHKLFGVRNILTVLKTLEPPEQDVAANTMIFEATVRANDPVGGCHRIISHLQRQINQSKAELDIVLHKLAILHAQSQNFQNPNLPNLPLSEVLYGHGVINNDPSTVHNNYNSMQDCSAIKVDPVTSLHNSMQFDLGASSSGLNDLDEGKDIKGKDIKPKNPSESATKICEKKLGQTSRNRSTI